MISLLQLLIQFGILLYLARCCYYLQKLKTKWYDQIKFEDGEIEKSDDLI